MSWSWIVATDRDGVFWRVKKSLYQPVTQVYHFDDRTDSTYIGRQVIRVTAKLSPIQARLYRLVYGSLP